MTWDRVMELAKLLLDHIDALLVAGPVMLGALGALGHLVHNIRVWAGELAEARRQSKWAAAQYLWKRGQQIKASLAAAGKSNADLLPQLRELVPDAMVQFGLAAGASRGDIEEILTMARTIHKSQKTGSGAVGTLAVIQDPTPAPAPPSPQPGAPSTGSEPREPSDSELAGA